ncbi:hypothetical protein [uncultured Campylobacter sp.]|uniref:hypothetical protein n=1 Tax=uncultured Campylobacter sp. TaxID=218934 RepID=UPI00261A7E35|nr:hypothetical protein [uncultured Campylobacter sp.]
MCTVKFRAAKNPTAMRDPDPTKSCRNYKILSVKFYSCQSIYKIPKTAQIFKLEISSYKFA